MQLVQRTIIGVMLLAAGAQAAVKSKVVDYKQGDAALQGFLAWDDSAKGQRPGVIIVHEWWGHNQHARNQALRLAKAGYVAFALDMFGKGKVTTHPKDAQAFVAETMKDPATAHQRFEAALDVLKKDPHVNPSNLGAIGYCFGGGVVLNEARQGANFKAIASFHGSLKTSAPAKPGAIKAEILVLHGEADTMITAEQLESFNKEMSDAGAKFHVVTYPGAKHGFTNPDAGKTGMDALAYNADADKKSWEEMLRTFNRVFGMPHSPG